MGSDLSQVTTKQYCISYKIDWGHSLIWDMEEGNPGRWSVHIHDNDVIVPARIENVREDFRQADKPITTTATITIHRGFEEID
jgi:hypothetical protein